MADPLTGSPANVRTGARSTLKAIRRLRADRLGRELGEAGITVLSSLAAGIDTSAHTGALAVGGRTVAVPGHGLLQPVYPKENRGLADELVGRGALLLQFRPDTPPTKGGVPMATSSQAG